MNRIADIAALEALYAPGGAPSAASLRKVARRMTPAYRTWIAASRFCLLSTVGPDGTDCSPRGDDGPVVTELDDGTLALPDWRGNNRLDSLRNIVTDGRVSLTFLVAGNDTIVRCNGMAHLSVAPDLLDRFTERGRRPRSVMVVAIAEIYTQCARALIRSALWSEPGATGLPTPGDVLAEMTQGEIDGAAYDQQWPARAAKTMW